MAGEAAVWIAELLFGLGRAAAKFSRRRREGDGDHTYSKFPELEGLSTDHTCKWCRQTLPGRPPRGCPGVVPGLGIRR